MRKKLFAVIMSVMMMVTFMPAMAFADTTVYKYSSDYSAVVDADGEWVDDTVKVFDQATGAIHVKPEKLVKTISEVEYYDFTDAYLIDEDTGKVRKTIDADYYLDMINQDSKVKDPEFAVKAVKDVKSEKYDISDLLGKKIVFVRPAKMDAVAEFKDWTYANDKEIEESSAQAASDFANDVDYKVGLQKYEAYDEAVTSLTFPVAASAKHENKLKDFEPLYTEKHNVIGLDKIKAEYTLKLTLKDYSHLAIHMDGMDQESFEINNRYDNKGSEDEAFKTTYCGANQNLKFVTKGVTAKFREQFGTTWSETAPEMVDAGEYSFYVELHRGTKTILNTEGGVLITVKVEKAPVSIQFKSTNLNFLPGTQVKASDVFTFKTALRKYSIPRKSSASLIIESEKGKDIDVFAADQATAQKIFDACVQLKNFPTQGETTICADFGLGEYNNKPVPVLDSDETKLKELINNDLDVAKFIDNYSILDEDGLTITDEYANVKYGVEYNDITAPNQTKTFHVKKAKALKSTKSFQLKATADYGTMTFTKMSGNSKIKVNSTGKVTVKKGLKKGKYVVKVKVKAPGTKTTKKLTVKVVK